METQKTNMAAAATPYMAIINGQIEMVLLFPLSIKQSTIFFAMKEMGEEENAEDCLLQEAFNFLFTRCVCYHNNLLNYEQASNFIIENKTEIPHIFSIINRISTTTDFDNDTGDSGERTVSTLTANNNIRTAYRTLTLKYHLTPQAINNLTWEQFYSYLNGGEDGTGVQKNMTMEEAQKVAHQRGREIKYRKLKKNLTSKEKLNLRKELEKNLELKREELKKKVK